MDFITKINDRTNQQKYGKFLKIISKIAWVENVKWFAADLVHWKKPNVPKMRLKAEFSFGNESDVIKLVSDPYLDAQNEKNYYLQKIQAGHKLLLATLRDEIVFYLWVVAGRKSVMDKFFLLNENEIAIERVFARKEYRGHGLFVYAFNYLCSQIQRDIVTCCLADIATHNIPMLRTAMKVGFYPLESYYYWLRLPFRQYVFPRGPFTERFYKKTSHLERI